MPFQHLQQKSKGTLDLHIKIYSMNCNVLHWKKIISFPKFEESTSVNTLDWATISIKIFEQPLYSFDSNNFILPQSIH